MAIRGNQNPVVALVPAAKAQAPEMEPRPLPAVDGSAALALSEPESAPLEGTIEPEQLVVIDPGKRLEIFTTPGGLEPIILAISVVARKHKPDITTKKGREAIASNAYKVARCKSLLDEAGKEETTKQKEVPARIDAARRDMRTRLESLQAEVRKPLTDWEADQTRQRQFVEEIQLRPMAFTESTVAEILAAITALEGLDLSPAPDIQDAAAAAKSEALVSLRDRLQKRQTYESEQAELTRLREEQAKRDAEAKEAQIRREAEEKARREAEARLQAEQEAAERREREAREAIERAARETAEAEQRAKDAEARQIREQQESEAREQRAREEATAAERRRQEALELERAERERLRFADVEHRRAFNREALADITETLFAAGIFTKDDEGRQASETTATAILRAIVNGKVRHAQMVY